MAVVRRYKPFDWIRGSVIPGQKYTAWNTYGQGTPDFGKGKGPGTPYHEVQKRIPKNPRRKPASVGIGTLPISTGNDPRGDAIQRRLRGLL